MYLRRFNRKKSGKSHFYWALVESYRTEKGSRQRIVGYIGDVPRRAAREIAMAAERCESYQQDFLSPEELPEKATVILQKSRTERHREFGGVWLSKKLFEKLELDRYFADSLERAKESADWLDIIKILVTSRFYQPSSELYIAEHLYEHSAMEDLFGMPAQHVYDNLLYRGLDKLLPHKDGLQRHLKERMGALFGIEYDLFLYDVTSTYVEGDHEGSGLCRRGYSRDSRPDCKQVCIGLVVTREGLPLCYEVFPGNKHDSTTVEQIVEKMERLYGKADRIWVMDRGMVSEENLVKLRKEKRRYIIGTPKACLKNVERHLLENSDWQVVQAGVEAKLCVSTDAENEFFILCRSKDRALKEHAIHDRFVQRIDTGLEKLKKTCEQRQGKDITKVIERRIGRLLQSNSRGAALFEISTTYDASQRKTVMNVQKNDNASHWLRLTEGHYLLRTNITDWVAKDLWQAYIHLTDAEEAFNIHKSDLHLRPLWHQKDDRILAHIFVCFLSFVMWKTFGLMCKNAGLGDEPRRVFNEIKKVIMVDMVLTTEDGKELKIRTVTRPDRPLQALLHRLNLRLPQRLSKRLL
jgi:transposase